MIVLGLDPGFAALGLAAVDLTPGAERVVRTAVIRTEKSSRKQDVRASDDNARRARELARALGDVVATYQPVALAAEAQSWPRNAGSSAKVGIAWGVLAAVAERHGLPLVQAAPQDVKRAVCGSKTASKGDVVLAVERRFPDVEWPSPASVVEHAADAVAVVLACMDSPVVEMARRLADRPVASAAPLGLLGDAGDCEVCGRVALLAPGSLLCEPCEAAGRAVARRIMRLDSGATLEDV